MMSDKFKGLLITFEKDFSEERVTQMKTILYGLKGVLHVTAYVKTCEDWMIEQKARIDLSNEIIE